MDIRGSLHFHLPRRNKGPESDPAQGLSTSASAISAPETAGTAPATLNGTADTLTVGISSSALEHAGVAIGRLGVPTDREPSSTPTRGRSKEQKVYNPGSQAPDFMKHMIGGLGDRRVRRVMQERKRQMGRPSPRKATT